jgi:prophage tail gpP-like protein
MLNKSEFNQEIEKFVKNTGETYIDAVIHYAEKNGLEVETISKMLNKVIRQKIESEASDLNLLKEKLCKLPV